MVGKESIKTSRLSSARSGVKGLLIYSTARFCLYALLLFGLNLAQAAYVTRFSTVTNGAITFTGNTIGLNKQASANAPGTSGAIGTFIADNNPTSVDGTYPLGTTATWQANAAQATLKFPIIGTSTVLYAELIWSGSYSYGGENVSAFLNNAVTFTTPSGTMAVLPDAATSQIRGTAGANGTCATGPCYYVRSANVTALVQAGKAGVYKVAGIPATQGDAENNANTGGWTLAVVYGNPTLASRSLSVFVGAELAGSAAASVTGFCVAPTGARAGRLLVSAIEGDSGIAGDQMLFGPTAATLTAQFGAKNLVGNFFASQINDDTGANDTLGSFGTANQTPGTSSAGRQGYDITNVDVSASLVNGQTSAFAQGTTTGDNYLINALGLQINVGSPSFPVTVKSVDKTSTVVGDTLTYTIRLDNSAGTADATNLIFLDPPPAGTTFLPGSVLVDGVAVAGNPAAGINVGTVAAGAVKTVQFKVVVNSIPAAPATATYSNSASWTYQFVSCTGQPTSNGNVATIPVLTSIARMNIAKTVSPIGTVIPGTTLTYSITLNNDGTAPSAGSTLQDGIPAGAAYLPGTTSLNGAATPDVAGSSPFVSPGLVNSTGQAAGILAVGQTATVQFQVLVNNNAAGTVTNTASGDIDGAGAAPASTAQAINLVKLAANLSITKSNGVSTLVAGATTTYTITVSNGGPSAADGALVRDPAVTGLSCTQLGCSSLGGAVCPVADIYLFQGSGLTIPTFPGNTSITLSLTCGVTATGL